MHRLIYRTNIRGKSYFSLGISLSSLSERTFPSLNQQLFAVQTVLQFYEYLDSKRPKNQPLSLSSAALPPLPSSPPSPPPKDVPPHKDENLDLHPTLSAESSSSRFTTATSFNTTSLKTNSSTRIPSSPSSSSLSTPSSPSNNSRSFRLKSLHPSKLFGQRRSIIFNTNTTVTSASSPSEAASMSSGSSLFKRNSNLPAFIQTKPALNLLSTLKTPSEDELPFQPDPLESIIGLLDQLEAIYDQISVAVADAEITSLEITNASVYLKTIDDILDRILISEALLSLHFTSTPSARDKMLLARLIELAAN